jgi:uncharacterized RDD family membrane protein YckC
VSEPPDGSRRLVISFDDGDEPAAPNQGETELRIALRPRAQATPPLATAPPPAARPSLGPPPPTARPSLGAPPPAGPRPLGAPPPRVSVGAVPASRPDTPPESWTGYASWGRRLGALLIDAVVLSAAAFVLSAMIGGAVGGGTSSAAAGFLTTYLVFWLVYGLAAAVYAPAMLARRGECNGQTLGKQALGIRVRHVSGAPVSLGQALLREIVMRQLVIGGIGWFVLLPLFDALWPLWHPENRSLHDLGASTIITRDPA